jgi:hypothetical protein
MPATFSVKSTLSSASEIGRLDKLQAFNSLTVCTNDKNFLVRSVMCLMVVYIYARLTPFKNLNKLKLIYPKRKTDMT